MVIYGVALLAGCMFAGSFIGNVLGVVTGVNSDVGGVGFAMLLLIIVSSKLLKKDKLSPMAQDGIMFWSSMYIPIVVAMTAGQNVVAALTGGWLALAAGALTVIVPLLLLPLLSKVGKPSEALPPIVKA